ncbi:MAG: hypothetical protein U5K69_04190, partial [Balneolaceae bacterium]|nr:hypothetical protein [Balneolaceae bacterium]
IIFVQIHLLRKVEVPLVEVRMECGDQATVLAIPADGYNFANWTEEGNQVSTNREYSFEVDRNRSLMANFEEEQISTPDTPDLSFPAAARRAIRPLTLTLDWSSASNADDCGVHVSPASDFSDSGC